MMKGCRPLSEEEIQLVFQKLGTQGKFGQRNQLLFIMGIKTGFRISELLSIRVKDVIQHNKVVARVTVTRAAMKGKIESRSVALHESVKPLIVSWVEAAGLKPDDALFNIRARNARVLLDRAFDVLRMDGKLSTHTLRKTFANALYQRLDHDLVKLQSAMGHKWVSTTAQYISFKDEEVDAAILAG
jgi:integrase